MSGVTSKVPMLLRLPIPNKEVVMADAVTQTIQDNGNCDIPIHQYQ